MTEANKPVDPLKPNAQLLVKLGSLIVHYEEFNSNKGHPMDKTAIDSLMSDEDVKSWMKKMNELALLPIKR